MDRHWRRLRLAVIVSDVLAVLLAYALVSSLRVRFGYAPPGLNFVREYAWLSFGMGVLTVLLGWQQGTYRRWALLGTHRVYPMLVATATYGVIAVIVLSFLVSGPLLVSRSWLLASWLATIVCLSMSRLSWRQVALRWQRSGRLVRKVLIAGANQHGVAVAEQLQNQARHGTRVLGFLDDYQRPGTEVCRGAYVVGHPGSVIEMAQALGADEVIIIAGALAWESQRLLAEIVTQPDCPIAARISPTFYDLLTTSAELSHIAYVPLLTLQRARLSGLNAMAKSLVDRSVAAVLLLALVPVWTYFRIRATALRVPMLLQHPVLGFAGRTFEVVGLNPRLTRSPVLARLPALWNVVWQDLSLVGPRPIRAEEVREHERWLANLFAMRPGLTGLWRLRGADLSIEERVALDMYYIRNYTLSLDGQILLNTFRELARRVLRRETALARWGRASGGVRRAPELAEGSSATSATPRPRSTEAPAPAEEARR
jgi:lipopolysaccharide/colanic/teichoic acid biosynthesis glycosyltransferase